MKFKDIQAPVLFSSTFNALNLGEKIKYFQGCVGTLVYYRILQLLLALINGVNCHWFA